MTARRSFRKWRVSNRPVARIWSTRKNRPISAIRIESPGRWARPAGCATARRRESRAASCSAAGGATKRGRPRRASIVTVGSNGVARSPAKFAPSRSTSTPAADQSHRQHSRNPSGSVWRTNGASSSQVTPPIFFFLFNFFFSNLNCTVFGFSNIIIIIILRPHLFLFVNSFVRCRCYQRMSCQSVNSDTLTLFLNFVCFCVSSIWKLISVDQIMTNFWTLQRNLFSA